jgi:hypothetical protein
MADDEKQERYPVRTEGPMYLHRMPTEKLQDALDSAHADLWRLRSELSAARRAACPDPECANCAKWRAWEKRHGDVSWGPCPTCRASAGQPCRRSWQGGGGSYSFVLKHPHDNRPGTLHPADPPEAAP